MIFCLFFFVRVFVETNFLPLIAIVKINICESYKNFLDTVQLKAFLKKVNCVFSKAMDGFKSLAALFP